MRASTPVHLHARSANRAVEREEVGRAEAPSNSGALSTCTAAAAAVAAAAILATTSTALVGGLLCGGRLRSVRVSGRVGWDCNHGNAMLP